MQQSTETSNRSAATAIAVFLFIAYLFPYHVAPIPSFYNDGFAVLGVLIAAAYWTTGTDKEFRLPWIMALPLALCIVVVAQALSGALNHASDAAIPVAYMLLAGLAIGLGATFAAGPSGAYRICYALTVAILFAALISVAISTLQLVRAEIPFYPFVMLMNRSVVSIRPHANIGQPNMLALLMCLALAAIWWLYQSRCVSRSVSIGVVFALLWGVTMTQSRIAWIILPLFALVCWQWSRRGSFVGVSGWFTFGCLLVYIAMASYGLPLISEIFGASIQGPGDRYAAGSPERVVLFQQALHMSLLHPWFGIGWDQFGPQQLLIAPDFPTTTYSRHAHNIVLNFAAELGWPITVAVFGVLGYWFVRTCLFPKQNLQVAFAGIVFIAVLVHSMVEFPLWYAYILLPICLLVGMVHFEQFGAPALEIPRVVVAVLFPLSFAATIGVADDYRRVLNGFWSQTMVSMGMAVNPAASQKPFLTVFPDMYDFFQYLNLNLHEAKSEEDLRFMEMVAKRFGGPEVWMKLSQAYAVNGRGDDAARAMNTIYRLHPGKYPEYFEQWKHAPAEYQEIFEQLPQP